MSRSTETLNRARLGVEALESRLTPAGNVTAVVQSGILHVQADRYNHSLEVQVHDDRIVVRALDATAINGQRPPTGFASQTFVGDQSAITALVFDGNSSSDSLYLDTSRLTAIRDLDVTARMNGSGDYFGLRGGKLSGVVDVDMGAGADTAEFDGDYSGIWLGVSLGAGNDTLRIKGSVGTVGAINGDGGKDSLEIPAAIRAAYSNVITGFETIKLT